LLLFGEFLILSAREISKLCGVEYSTILYWMKKFGIERRSKSDCVSGEKNPMFGKKHSDEDRKKISLSQIKLSMDDVRKLVPENYEILSTEYNGKDYPIVIKCQGCETITNLKNAKNAFGRECKKCTVLLKDNNPLDDYFYELIVFTGNRRESGTRSKVITVV
jgi:DNA-binding transcriptional MerR regulator